MTTPYFYAIGAGVANAVVALGSKAAERHHCRPGRFGVVVLGAATVLCLVAAVLRGEPWRDARLWLLGAVMGALFFGAIRSILYANRFSPPSLVWSLANLALILPILLAAAFLHEPLKPLDALVLVAFGLMLVALAGGGAAATPGAPGTSRDRWLALLAVFVTNGLLMFGFKLHEAWVGGGESASLGAIMYGSGCLLALAQQLWREPGRFTASEVGAGLAVGLATGCAVLSLLQAMALPAAGVFPVIQGVSLVGGIGLTAAVYREHLTVRKGAGILLGVAVIVLALLRKTPGGPP